MAMICCTAAHRDLSIPPAAKACHQGKGERAARNPTIWNTFRSTGEDPPWRAESGPLACGFQSSPAAILTVSARMTVLKTKPMKPCKVASRRIFRDVMFTSDTWKVMPRTMPK